MTISDSSMALPVGLHVIPSDIDYISKSFKKDKRRNNMQLRNILVTRRELEGRLDI